AAGLPIDHIATIPDEAPPDRASLEAAGVDLLAIYTGDGTVNGVVTELYGWAGRVLVLPGGTQNLLAKALHGDVDAAGIVAAMGESRTAPVERHLIRSSQGDALCEVLAGPGAKWSDVREAMREGDLGEMAASLGEAIGQSAGGAPVRVVEPVLGRPEGYPAVLVHPVGEKMIVDGYGAETMADYAKQGLALLRRDFREGPHDELGSSHPAIICESDEPIELMIDGERMTGGVQERFEILKCAVEFLSTSGHPPPS
ncbi:MAG: diacylglycerol kinase family protein, partial [Novosphingobium sp.]|nr:diacylglycerol kinase family protein [Novosphingobium sp.]